MPEGVPSQLVSKDKLSKTGFKMGKKILGVGSQATVYAAFNKKTGKTAAVKVYEKKKKGFDEGELRLEIDAMSRCQHPGVVALLGAFGKELLSRFCAHYVRNKGLLSRDATH
eukprot:SAG31_NODE_1564_length_7868_cov_5.665766_3_plen_112_part_00